MTSTVQTATAPVPPHVPAELVHDFDFYDMAGETDVYQRYRKLHALPDIFWTPRHGGHWVVQRFDDMSAVFKNPEVFSNRQQTIPPAPNAQFGMVMFDGEKHLAYRRLIQPTLVQPLQRPSAEGERLDAFITQVANSLIDGMIDRGECEFFADFAMKLPMTVVMKALVDLPIEDAPLLEQLTDAVARAGADRDAFNAAFAGLAEYFLTKIIPEKRANPGTDTISAIVHGRPEGRPLSDIEIIAECSLVMIGGLDTVSASMAFTAQYLAEHPEQRRRLIDSPELIPEAVEEFLRRFGIVNISRYVARDTVFNGVHFAEGDIVLVPSTAASVDDRHFPDPLTVDFDRKDKQHLTFHRGPHLCVGHLVARRELRIFLTEWLRRIPDFAIKPGAQIRAITGLGNRLVELPLVWDPPAPEAADVAPGEPWLTADQRDIDAAAGELMEHPEVRAAREAATARLREWPEAATTDGPATLGMAVDNLMFGCLQLAVNDDPPRPRVVWSARLGYPAGDLRVHDSRYGGDVADRVYRQIGVRPGHRYEITGRRHPTHPSDHDFSFEAVPAPGLWGQPTVMIRAPHDVDVAADGTFTVTADATPAGGRRNHLRLPEGTTTIFVRDTLRDWAAQVPNEVTVRAVDGGTGPVPGEDEVAAAGVSMFRGCLDGAEMMFANAVRTKPRNTLSPFLRPVRWGVGGGVISVNAFDLEPGQALVLTLDLITAGYLSLAAHDPWMTSIGYDVRAATLNNTQAQPDADGGYTFVVSAEDPGVHNWLDTGGLRSGVLLARWERFEHPPEPVPDDTSLSAWVPRTTITEAVRDARVLPVGDAAAAVPPGQARVGPAERAELVAARLAAYRVRVTGVPIGEPR